MVRSELKLSTSLVKSQLCYYRNLAKIVKDKGQLDVLLDHTLPVSTNAVTDEVKIVWDVPSPSDGFYGRLHYDFGSQAAELANCGSYTLNEPISGVTSENHLTAFKTVFTKADQLAQSIWSTQFQAKFTGSDGEKILRLCQVSNQCQIKYVESPETWVTGLVKYSLWQDLKCQTIPDAFCCLDQSASQQCMVFSPLSMAIEYIENLNAIYQDNQSGGQDEGKQGLGKELGTGGWLTASIYYNALVQDFSKNIQDDLSKWIRSGDVSGPVPNLSSDDIYLRGAYQYVDKYLNQVALTDLIDSYQPKQQSSGDFVENLYISVKRFMPDGGFDENLSVKDIPQEDWQSMSTFGDAFWCGIGIRTGSSCPVSQASDSFSNTLIVFFLNPANVFADSYDPHLSNKAINSDIQLYLAKLAQGWVDVFIQPSSNDGAVQASQDPIALLQNFGESLISNNINFISHLTKDVVLTNFQT